MKKNYCILTAIFFCLWASGLEAKKNTVTQISTLDALLGGVFEGETSLGQLRQHGNFGLGTLNGLDGELILLDDRFYRVAADGSIQIPPDKAKTPFATVCPFQPTIETALPAGLKLENFPAAADKLLRSPNLIYAIKVEGVFKSVRTRSVPKQKKPYPPIAEVVKQQPTFTFENRRGTLVGFRFPPYMKNLNFTPYHLHFLTADGKGGGHVLDFEIAEAVIKIDELANFQMLLPANEEFRQADLSADRQETAKKVEQGK